LPALYFVLLTDLNSKLDVLNLEFQEKGKHIAEMISSVRELKAKLPLCISNTRKKIVYLFSASNESHMS
jgi:hypothetical protein